MKLEERPLKAVENCILVHYLQIVKMNCRFFVLLIFLIPEILYGQDPGFSQFYSNPLYLNPAFTGTTELPRTTLNYRNQWPQKGATYTTYSLSFDRLSKKLNTGFGFLVLHDKELNKMGYPVITRSFFYWADKQQLAQILCVSQCAIIHYVIYFTGSDRIPHYNQNLAFLQ